MKNKLFASLTLAFLSTLNLPLSTLHAQGTAFTYQGRLNDGANPANGSYDLTFTVFDAGTNGTLVGGPFTNATVVISNGLFTTTLDFGAGVFGGSARWLEVGVATNGGGSFATLSPRQAILPAPYAIYATTASNVVLGAVVKSLNALKDDVTLAAGSNVTITPSGNTLTIDSAGAGGSGIWNLNGNDTYFTTGKVGIGTNAPNHRLRVVGGPAWTANGWGGAIELETASAIGWHANPGGQCFGIGQSFGGLYFFHSTSDPGTTATPANYDMEITDFGNVMIAGGAERPGVKLQVNGGAAFGPMGSGGEVAFGSPNAETGMTIIGSARADIRFDGSTLKLLAGPVGGPPSSANGVAITTAGNVGIGTTSPSAKLDVTASGDAIHGTSTGGAIGVYGLSDNTGVYGDATGNGEGVHGRSAGNGAAVNGTSTGGGTGVYGTSATGWAGYFTGNVNATGNVYGNSVRGYSQNGFAGVYGRNDSGTGWAGFFQGNVNVTGTLSTPSDRNVKRDFAAVDSRQVLEKVARMAIQTWAYTNSPGIRHLGPVAQDFKAAFELGADDKSIATVDADGVALAAIQGLNQKVEDLNSELKRRDTENVELKQRLERLEQLMNHNNGGAR